MVILLKFLIIGVFGVLTWLANWRRGRQTEARFSCSIAAAVLQCPELGDSGLDIDTIHQYTIHLEKASICALTLYKAPAAC